MKMRDTLKTKGSIFLFCSLLFLMGFLMSESQDSASSTGEVAMVAVPLWLLAVADQVTIAEQRDLMSAVNVSLLLGWLSALFTMTAREKQELVTPAPPVNALLVSVCAVLVIWLAVAQLAGAIFLAYLLSFLLFLCWFLLPIEKSKVSLLREARAIEVSDSKSV